MVVEALRSRRLVERSEDPPRDIPPGSPIPSGESLDESSFGSVDTDQELALDAEIAGESNSAGSSALNQSSGSVADAINPNQSSGWSLRAC